MTSEFQRIEILRGLLSISRPAFIEVPNGDDAAVLSLTGNTVLTTDALVDDVDFSTWAPWPCVGHKALATNLSDLAAMGADPVGYLLFLCLPPSFSDDDLRALATGMAQLADHMHVTCVGGDISRTSGPLVINITAVGEVPRGRALTRSGTKVGDAIFVSGNLGGAAAGLKLLMNHSLSTRPKDLRDVLQHFQKTEDQDAIKAQLTPEPRVGLGKSLRDVATACMDVTDGLIQDLSHLLVASGVGAELEMERIPVHPGVPTQERRKMALAGGEELELLFTSAGEDGVRKMGEELGITLTRIGKITSTKGLKLGEARLGEDDVARLDRGETPLAELGRLLRGFQHFG